MPDSSPLSSDTVIAVVAAAGALGAASTGFVNAFVKSIYDLWGIRFIWTMFGTPGEQHLRAALKFAYGDHYQVLIEGKYRQGGTALTNAIVNGMRLSGDFVGEVAQAVGQPANDVKSAYAILMRTATPANVDSASDEAVVKAEKRVLDTSDALATASKKEAAAPSKDAETAKRDTEAARRDVEAAKCGLEAARATVAVLLHGHSTVMVRFEAALTTRIEAAIATADASNARAMRVFAALVSIVSGVGVASSKYGAYSKEALYGFLIGLIAVPVSPVVHDLAGLVTSARNVVSSRVPR